MSGFKDILKDRFGMFVHYGIYSEMAGEYKGEECTHLGEWIQHCLKIPNEEYAQFGKKHFLPSPDFAKNLVKSAKDAGIRYIVLTSKHHDGFCLFKSDYTDYSSYEYFGRDICRELADECKKEGLGLGLYYSHTLDWHEKDAGGNFHSAAWLPVKNRNDWDFPDENFDFEKYLYEKCFPQVRELLTNYGDLKLIWFDYPHNITKEQSRKLRALVKELQPNCQINSRIAHDCNDYVSLGDNALPTAPTGVDLECLITLNDTWGYKKQDNNWKTSEDVIGVLSRTLGSDSTLLLNVGPMGDGTLTDETLQILKKTGEWTRRNSEAIYGNVQGNPFSCTFEWGCVSTKEKCLYLYVKDKTQKNLYINVGKNNIVKSVSLIGDVLQPEYTLSEGLLTVNPIETDFEIPVYKIEFENEPIFDKSLSQIADTLNLDVLWASKVTKGNESDEAVPLVYEKSEFSSDYGKHGLAVSKDCNTAFWTDCSEVLCWDAYFKEAGEYEATLTHYLAYIFTQNHSYLYEEPREAKAEFTLSVAGQVNDVDMQSEKSRYATSKTSKFNTYIRRNAGKFTIEKAGKYRILLFKKEGFDDLPITRVTFTINR